METMEEAYINGGTEDIVLPHVTNISFCCKHVEGESFTDGL
jgi:hypothetical protein